MSLQNQTNQINKPSTQTSPAPNPMTTEITVKTIAGYWNIPLLSMSKLISRIEQKHAKHEKEVKSSSFYQNPTALQEYPDDCDGEFENNPYEYDFNKKEMLIAEAHLEYLKSLPKQNWIDE